MGEIKYNINTQVRQLLEIELEKAKQECAKEAWDLARRITLSEEEGGMSSSELRDCFGTGTSYTVFYLNETYEKASKMYNDWLKKNEKVKVGDEIINMRSGERAVVTWIDGDDWNGFALKDCNPVAKRGEGYTVCKMKGWEKTGRHFSEINEIFKKSKEM